MYLHIGKDIIINNKDIIGIFNVEYIKNTKEFKALFNSLKEKNDIINISENQNKTFILTKIGNKVKGYTSNIGAAAIGKRNMY